MKVIKIERNDDVYSCNAYLVLGSWNKISDVNTLIDTGSDNFVVGAVEHLRTGVGKKPVDQVILTHTHFDHCGGLELIGERFNPAIYAFNRMNENMIKVADGNILPIGDTTCEVIHMPGHSSDSICLYCEEYGVLFSGDTPIKICSVGGSYSEAYVKSLQNLVSRKIDIVYPGHDEPIKGNVRAILLETLKNVRQSRVVADNESHCSGRGQLQQWRYKTA
jgi:glyoxylase-like metal-dependent hydrolase (beta-lactamase superfamily II)